MASGDFLRCKMGKKMKKVAVALTALFALFTLSGGLLWAETVGEIAYLQGSVSIVRDDQTISSGIEIGYPIQDLDMIQTGSDGEVTITTESEGVLDPRLS